MATSLVDLTELTRPTRGQAYFNPRPEKLVLSYGGCPYVFQRGYGELAIRYSTQNSPVYRDTGEAHTPKNLFKHFFGDDGRTGKAGECGVRPVFGDSRDAMIVEEAETAFREAQYAADMRIKAAHMARVANERQAGSPVTSPSPAVQEAMARIAKRDAENGWSSAFACPHCAAPSKNAEERTEHIAQIHPDLADLKATPQMGKSDKSSELEALIAAQTKLIQDQAAAMAALQAGLAEVQARKKPGPKPKVKSED
jgi:hypothetical protein